jgi:hypothetical protein
MRTWVVAAVALFVGSSVSQARNPFSECGLPDCSGTTIRLSGLLYDPPLLNTMKVRLTLHFPPTGPDGEGGGAVHGTFACRELSPSSHCVGHSGRVVDGVPGFPPEVELCPGGQDTAAGVGYLRNVGISVAFPDGSACVFTGISPRESPVQMPSVTGTYQCKGADGTQLDSNYFALARPAR